MDLEVLNNIDIALHAGALLSHWVLCLSDRVPLTLRLDQSFDLERHLCRAIPHSWADRPNTLKQECPSDLVVLARAFILDFIEVNWLS